MASRSTPLHSSFYNMNQSRPASPAGATAALSGASRTTSPTFPEETNQTQQSEARGHTPAAEPGMSPGIDARASVEQPPEFPHQELGTSNV